MSLATLTLIGFWLLGVLILGTSQNFNILTIQIRYTFDHYVLHYFQRKERSEMKVKNVSLVAKVSPEMKRQIFAIAEKRNDTAATVMREMIRECLEKTA